MADNLTTTTTVSTIPSGTVIATDDAGAAGHVQLVKLAISTDGSATAIPAEAANGLDVDVTRVQGTVTVDSELPAAAALGDAVANPTVPAVGSFNMLWDTKNSQWVREAISHTYGNADYSTTQTGTTILTPSSTARTLIVTDVVLGTGGTTAALVTIWFGDSGDTAFTSGTDRLIFRGTLTPTANATPGVVIHGQYHSGLADRRVKVTTSAGITLYVNVIGFEI